MEALLTPAIARKDCLTLKCYDHIQTPQGPLAAALGSFDGLHLGHQRVIGSALDSPGLLPAVVTFPENPLNLLRKQPVPMLTTNQQRLSLLEQMGVDTVYLLPFAAIREMEPEDFVRILHQECRVEKICCGFNFRFGREGRGDTKLLHRMCRELGMELSVSEPVSIEGAPVSSTRIRACLEKGDVVLASRMLGRPFQYDFPVVHGRQLGRTLGTPTINQPFPEGYILPRFGVYASLAHIDGKTYHGVTNIGVKPTVGAEGPLSETWLPEFSGDLYGKNIPVDLLAFIRPEKKFDNLEALQAEILRNGETARQIAQDWERRLENGLFSEENEKNSLAEAEK